MKKSLLFIVTCVSAMLTVLNIYAQSNEWTWVNGSSSYNQSGVYGTMGQASAGNVPGGREGGVYWTDASGNFYLFGGYGFDAFGTSDRLNDMWKWDGTNWTWISGNDTSAKNGVYGTQGVSSANNIPGARMYASTCKDASGNIWLFGGSGFGSTGGQGQINDLWKWNGTKWTWMSGNTSPNKSGVYGTQGQTTSGNYPGGRYNPLCWADASGNVWVFGGYGFDVNGKNQFLNDLWKWDGTNWTWMTGSNIASQSGVYGTIGQGSTTNTPGARSEASYWTDASGNFWLFGGYGIDGSGAQGYLNDLWKWDGSKWTWVSGGSHVNVADVYGTLGIPAATNMPGCRAWAYKWVDVSGNFWIWGGAEYDGGSHNGATQDLWKWDGTNWTWLNGSNQATFYPTANYGTLGVASSTYIPMNRFDGASWADASGNLWLFGGDTYQYGSNVYKDDLWKYVPCKPTSSVTNTTVCSNQLPYRWNGNNYNSGGTYVAHILNKGGCDSAATLNLTVNQASHSITNLTITASQTPYSWNGRSYNYGGIDTVHFTNKAGCDSAAVIYLTITGLTSPTVPGQWTWMNGSPINNRGGVYGTIGVQSTFNTPPPRGYADNWTDKSGNFWLFGGTAYNNGSYFYNDLWKWDGSQWTWMNGNNGATSSPGVYGTKGTASSSNVPGARAQATSWTDASGNFWLFGGGGFDANGTDAYLNDLWKWNGSQWTWVSGSNLGNQKGTYGTLGTTASTNVPGAREDGISWVDASGNLWLFGGKGEDGNGNIGNLNDLWKWDGTNWTWISGSNTKNQNGIYGTKGTSASSNMPGGRYASAVWTDASGNAWIFGGEGYDASSYYTGSLNDMWKWDGTNWTWMGGSSVQNSAGSYGTKGTSSANNIPGARQYPKVWVDASANVWLFGGLGYNTSYNSGYLNDLWKWDGTNWTWISGSNNTSQKGIYGKEGQSGSTNIPGTRVAEVVWKDASDNLWLFGAGWGVDSTNNTGALNDLWRYTLPAISNACVPTTYTIDTAICAGISYSFHGKIFTTAGAHLDTLTNVGGCDSIVTINLTIKQPTTSITPVSICSNALPYSWNGHNYSTAGRDTVHLVNKAGCDSITILVLTVKQTSISTTPVSICSNQLPYNWNGNNYSTAGRDTVHLTNKAGCDSVTILVLTIKQTSISTTNVTICANALPYRWNNTNYNTAGNYTIHLTNKVGCDSAATLVLAVTTPATPSVRIIITPDSVIAHGTSVKFTALVSNGGTTPGYQWKKNGISITGATGSTYITSGLANGDAITCIATSNLTCVTATTAISNKITMNVNSTPCATAIASPTPAVIQVCNGSSVVYTSAVITGNAIYKWQYTTGSETTVDSAWHTFGSNSNTATLTGVTQKTYTRLIVTVPGCAAFSSNTAIINVDSTVLKVNVTSVNTSSALLNWNAINGATYSIVVNGHSYTSATNSYQLTGLSACRTYNATVTAIGAACGGTHIGNTTFATPASNLALSFSAGAGRAFIASWSAGTGPYKLYYGIVGSGNYTGIGVTGTSYTIANPTASQSYIGYVVDLGSLCTPQAQSNYAYYNVPGGSCVSVAPTIVSATSTSSSFTINWTGSASQYEIIYTKLGGGSSNGYSSTNTFTVNGLSPNTAYVYCIANRCGTGYGYTTPMDTIYTQTLCNAPLNLELSMPTCNGFTSTWNTVPGALYYSIYFTHNGTTASYRSNTNSLVYAVGTLGIVYSAYVTAACPNGGQSLPSNTESIRLLQIGCKDGDINTQVNTANTVGINVYPNPNNGNFTVSVTSANTKDAGKLQVINLLGEVMVEAEVANNNGLVYTTVNNTNLAAGVYLVRLQIDAETYTARLCINH